MAMVRLSVVAPLNFQPGGIRAFTYNLLFPLLMPYNYCVRAAEEKQQYSHTLDSNDLINIIDIDMLTLAVNFLKFTKQENVYFLSITNKYYTFRLI